MKQHSLEKDRIYTTKEQVDVRHGLAKAFEGGLGNTADKLSSFSKYVSRQDLSLFLARYEIFKMASLAKGSIVECGVYYGNGLMTWAQLSAALEPTNYNRRIIGFDTFTGNVGESNKDHIGQEIREDQSQQATYKIDSEEEILKCIGLYDRNRFLNHIPKVSLVRGDIVKTVPQYLADNPHFLVSLLSLSVNLYEPTKIALKWFIPRMPVGSVIAIHTLNEAVFPGATLALLEELDIRSKKIESFPYAPNLSYVIM